jgi:polar amino acid transport system substrate-binding protein
MLVRLVFISLLLICAPNGIAEQLRYASIFGLVEQEVGRLVIPEVYKKLDLQVLIVPMPAQQAQKNARSGKYDGEIMRIWSYGEESTDVIRVPTPYYQLETMAFYKLNQGIQISSKEELVNYRLLKILGVKHTENITSGLQNVVNIDSTDKMMQLLEYGRADVALTNTIDGIVALKRLKIDNIVHLEKPLAVLDLYHYIHRSHKELVPLVDGILQKMQSSGELKLLVERAEKSVIHDLL